MKPPSEVAVMASNRWARQFPKPVSALRRLAFAIGYQQRIDEENDSVVRLVAQFPKLDDAVSQTQLPRETLEDHFFKYPSVIGSVTHPITAKEGTEFVFKKIGDAEAPRYKLVNGEYVRV